MTTGNFEAVKYSYRQSKDGFVLAFVVHPSDMTDDMATALIGTRFMIGYAEIKESGPQPRLTTGPAEGGAVHTGARAVPPSSKYPAHPPAPDRGEDATQVRRDAASPQPKPNSTRAVMMAKSEEFREFLRFYQTAMPADTEEEADKAIKHVCNVDSKTELNAGEPAKRFEEMRQDFRKWRGS